MNTGQIIFRQLGGQYFACMTGSHHFAAGDTDLSMHLRRNKSGANRLTITLDPDDTYSMRFYKFTAGRWKVDYEKQTVTEIPDKYKEIKELHGIYWDQLQDVFESTTGMYTHF